MGLWMHVPEPPLYHINDQTRNMQSTARKWIAAQEDKTIWRGNWGSWTDFQYGNTFQANYACGAALRVEGAGMTRPEMD